MEKKLKATPKHIAEFLNYTITFHEECVGLIIKPENITKVIQNDVNWTVDLLIKEDVDEKAMQALSQVIDMHAKIIEVVWDD